MKNINKIIAYLLCTILIISNIFHYSFKIAYGADIGSMLIDESFIETWLFPIFSLNNEWSFGQSGLNLKDAIEESAGANNISYSTDFNNAYASAFGLNDLVDPFDLSQADEFFGAFFATSADYNRYVAQHKISDIQDYLTSEDSAALSDMLIDSQKMQLLGYNSKSDAFNDCIVATIQIGKQKMLVAFTEAGEWLGNSFSNIITSVEQLTQTEKINLQNSLKTEYPTQTLGFSNYQVSFGSDTNYRYTYTYNMNLPCVVFYKPNSDYAYIGSIYGDPTGTINVYFRSFDGSYSNHYNINPRYYRPTTITTSNGYTFTYLYCCDTSGVYKDSLTITYDDVISYIESLPAYSAETIDDVIPPYTVPLVDESSQPYVVPDIQGLAQTIDHIYPAIDAIRESILTIPSDIAEVLSLVDTVPATIAEDIADIIADVIANAISIPDILTETTEPEPGPEPEPDNPLPEYPPELPSWFWPSLFPDVFDFKGLEIFKPIFDIVGQNYSMYSIWSLIPAIIIFVVIIYFIISVL